MKLQRRALVRDVPRCLLRASAARNRSSHLVSPAGSPETPEHFPASGVSWLLNFQKETSKGLSAGDPFCFPEESYLLFRALPSRGGLRLSPRSNGSTPVSPARQCQMAFLRRAGDFGHLLLVLA